MTSISNVPISTRILRSRTFRLFSLRPDFADVISQFVILLSQLRSERFTGSLTLNFNQGGINNVQVTETHDLTSIPSDKNSLDISH